MVIEGQAKQAELLSLCRNLVELYDDAPLQMEPEVENLMAESVTSFRCLIALLDSSLLDAEAGDDVEAVIAEKRKSKIGVMFAVREAMKDNEFWELKDVGV